MKKNHTMSGARAFALAAMIAALSPTPTHAGGILTNTNQNIAFNRNMARDGAIGIDGVYSNPAGVAFLTDGFHLSLNIQSAFQNRNVTTSYGNLFLGNINDPAAEHKYKGKANAPVVPSLQAALNRGRWSFQLGFAIVGGGGKCTFDNGLGSFEGVVAQIPAALVAAGATGITGGYSYDSYMRGRQYYWGFTLGTAYKVLDNLSVYGGLRVIYANANYFGYVKNIALQTTAGTTMPATDYFIAAHDQYVAAAAQCEAAGMAEQAAAYTAQANKMTAYAIATQDIELNCDQTAWGVAPIIGVDWKAGRLNLASKFEFKTRLRLKNESANSASAAKIAMLDQFKDGESVAGDMPALFALGAQYELTQKLRLMAGYHHFFDVDTKQFTKDDLGDTDEYLFGAEYDINDRLQVSAGVQRTDYDIKPAHMNDISFSLDSWTWGLGIGYQVSKCAKVNLAYFESDYDDYNKTETLTSGIEVKNRYQRTNHVLGVGVDLTF